MKRLEIFFDKSGRPVRLMVSNEIIWSAKPKEVIRLIQQALEYYQEKRTAEIGERAFFEEIFQILTREGVSESRRELLRREFEKLGLLASDYGEGEQETERVEQVEENKVRDVQEIKETVSNVPASSQAVPKDEAAESSESGEGVRKKKFDAEDILPMDIMKLALKSRENRKKK